MQKARLLLLALLALQCQTATPGKEEPPTLPAWSDVVFYQIFPDRFANGDPANDPTFEDTKGGWPDLYFDSTTLAMVSENWQVHPWKSDWYELQPWESGVDWPAIFDWAKPDDPMVKTWAGLRRYGGDLQGVIDRLDYLQDLGVNALYLNPIFESPSLHKYDATMYHHVDNNFGPDPAGDRALWAQEDPGDPATWQWTAADSLFLELIAQCHQRGMRIIIDGVFNHTGNTFWAFRDLQEKQEASAYKDWYIVHRFDDPATAENEFRYEGWVGVETLPEIREDENGLVTGPREHVHAIVQRWMDPNGDGDPSDGIDGWRLDVSEMVDVDFWKEFRQWVKEINPDGYITGEYWWEDYGHNVMHNAADRFDIAFDAVMNYRLARAMYQFIGNREKQIDARGFADSLQNQYREYPWERVLTCQNLLCSHDVDRFSSQVVNPDRWIDHAADPYGNPDYLLRAPNAEEWQKVRLAAGLQMTLPGAPMVYYGEEAGMWGGDDPDCRKPMTWPEMNFPPEAHDQFGRLREPDPVGFDPKLFDWYQNLIEIRRGSPALLHGQIEFLQAEGPLLVFRRSTETESAIVVANNAPVPLRMTLNTAAYFPEATELVDRLSGTVYSTPELPLELSNFGIVVLTKKN